MKEFEFVGKPEDEISSLKRDFEGGNKNVQRGKWAAKEPSYLPIWLVGGMSLGIMFAFVLGSILFGGVADKLSRNAQDCNEFFRLWCDECEMDMPRVPRAEDATCPQCGKVYKAFKEEQEGPEEMSMDMEMGGR